MKTSKGDSLAERDEVGREHLAKIENRFLVPALLLLSLLPVAQTWSLRHTLLIDDALITLTYARNLAEGNGFVFNAPPAVLGTTTPLWALLCAASHFLLPRVELTTLAVLGSGCCWLASIWTLFFFRREFSLSSRAVFLGAAVIACLNWPETLGMEGYLFMFLLLLCLGFHFSNHPMAAGVTTSLLFLTRGEGILMIFVLGAALLLPKLMHRRPASLAGIARLLLGFTLPLVAWSLYALPTFGHVIPNTLAAKLAQARSGLWPTFWSRFWTNWLPTWHAEWHFGTPWLNLWLVLALVGIWIVVRQRKPMALLLGWGFLYFVGYSLLGVAAYGWYLLPVTWVAGLAVAEGAAAITRCLDRFAGKRLHPIPVGWLLSVVWVAMMTIPVVATIRSFRPHPKYPVYREMCRWFDAHATPRQSIAFFEVGYLGYYTKNPIVDQVGLVTAGFVPAIARRDFSSVFWTFRPDYLAVYEGYNGRGI